MADLTRKELKEVFIEALDPFAKSVQQDFRAVNSRLDGVDKRLDGFDLRFDGVDKRLDGFDLRFDGLEHRMNQLETEWATFRKNASELFVKLDDLITIYRKQEAELSTLAVQVVRLETRLAEVEAKLAKR